jgi:hypothetical protein
MSLLNKTRTKTAMRAKDTVALEALRAIKLKPFSNGNRFKGRNPGSR